MQQRMDGIETNAQSQMAIERFEWSGERDGNAWNNNLHTHIVFILSGKKSEKSSYQAPHWCVFMWQKIFIVFFFFSVLIAIIWLKRHGLFRIRVRNGPLSWHDFCHSIQLDFEAISKQNAAKENKNIISFLSVCISVVDKGIKNGNGRETLTGLKKISQKRQKWLLPDLKHVNICLFSRSPSPSSVFEHTNPQRKQWKMHIFRANKRSIYFV